MKPLKHLCLQILLIGLLALASGYQLPDFSEADWSTVLFLTPWGILTNFAYPSAITTFYVETARYQLVAEGWALLVMLALYAAMLVNVWRFFRKGPR